jgi:hypothetical protein
MEVVVYLKNKYQDNPYMSKKLENYLENLPQVMQGLEEEYFRKLRLKTDFVERRDNYIEWFVTHHSLFYHAPTENYYKYSRNTFTVVSEDELMQLIMRSLHVDFDMHRGKQQMKRRMIRRVKNMNLFNIEPTVTTIDNVLRNLYSHFTCDMKSTYFLVCIGDILLGKRNLFYFMDPSFKPFVYTVAQGLYTAVNKHISDHFKFKYYEHEYQKCRIIPGVCETTAVRTKYVDLAVTATYFSNRYGSSDVYLSQCGSTNFEEQAMILHTYSSPTMLLDAFLAEFTVPEGSVAYKSVYFLWKMFLFKKTLPFVLSQQNFKQLLITNDIYNAETDLCKVRPKCSLSILNFEMFWSQCVAPQSGACYSVQEFVSLYNDWCDLKHLHISPEECADWLNTVYSEHTVGNMVNGFKCKLWDKTMDIENALEAHSTNDKELYAFYCDYISTHGKRVVSKEFFDSYIESR